MPEPESILPGADPFVADGGPGGVLLVHGFTSTPQSLRPLAEVMAAAGLAVEVPLLPGHGTSVDDLMATRWDDWSGAAETAYEELGSTHDRVVVGGLSMGGTIACWLAAHHPEVAGLVLVNPHLEPAAESFLEILSGMLSRGASCLSGLGSDIADPGQREVVYEQWPIEPLMSLFQAVADLEARLVDVRCPVLLFTSRHDHVVPPSSSDLLAARASGPVQRVRLERSYHVATLDFDRAEIETVALDFVRKVTAS